MVKVRGPWSTRTILVSVVSATVIAVSVVAWIVAPRAYRSVPAWGSHHIVVSKLPYSDAEELLANGGIGDVVGPVTTKVMITRFSRIDQVPLATAIGELDEMDPRRDPFISGLESYFSPKANSAGYTSVLYVDTGRGAWRTSRLVRRALGPGSRVADYSPRSHAVAILIYLVACGLIVGLHSRRRLPAAAVSLIWLPVVVSAGIPGLVGGSMFVLVWTMSAADLRGALADLRSLRVPSLLGGVAALWPVLAFVIAGFSVAGWVGPAGWFRAAVALAGSLGVTIFVPASSSTATTTDHDLFRPVSLITGTQGETSGLSFARAHPGWSLAIVALFLVVPVVAGRLDNLNPVTVPRPAESGFGPISFENVGRLWDSRRQGDLVAIDDYLAHRAYQQGLTYGRGYFPPVEGEALTLSRFRETDSGAYAQYAEEVAVFDDNWLLTALADPPDGIPSLLVSQAKVAGVVAGPERGLYSRYPQVLKHSVFVVLVGAPVVLLGRSAPRLRRRHSKVVEIARRRKQVA